ncbi:hypothetical protein BOX15_Mlig001943g9 [Macrostomum lignano]|uniref:Uncharacterized protein n=1 Tax=Macrostomum lignano TaxID=282301 RepID=A0A267DY11_9PLAT|nr:hypothetical protein BOX15_Mlig001943g9 [Macrostomum lignano]
MSRKEAEDSPSPSGSSASSTIKWRVASGLLGVGAVLCLAAGLALPHLARGMFSDKLAKLLPISADSPTYSSWVSSELRFQVWLWNITNSWAVMQEGAKPSLEQVGPFTFAETRTRDGVKFYENATVSYDDVRAYYFLSEESVGSMHDFVITNVNLPYLTIALKMRGKSVFYRNIMQNFFAQHGGGILSNRTAHELLLGYEDPALKKMRGILRKLGQKVPEKFGLLVGKNNSAKGTALVGTGSASLADLSQVQRWNGQSKLEVWPGDFGNRLTGSSDGSMFPPPVSAGSSLKVFTPDLCRSADLSYSGDDRVREIPVLRFQVAKSSMMNASANPDNAAFCTPRCLDSGVLNLTLCLPGNPPIVASAPHFHGAPTYRAAVSLQPAAPADGEPPFEFNTRLEVEPNTGLLLRAARRMQINAALEQVAGFSDTDRFSSPLLMPYAWLNESGGIGVEAAARFRGRVLQPLRLSSLISWLLLAAGLALLILCCVVCSLEIRLRVADRIRAARRQEQPLESMNSSDLADLYSEESKLKLRTGDDAGQLDKVEKPKTGADIEERLLKDAPALPETDIV